MYLHVSVGILATKGDLGEVHPFVITNEKTTTIYNGGEL